MKIAIIPLFQYFIILLILSSCSGQVKTEQKLDRSMRLEDSLTTALSRLSDRAEKKSISIVMEDVYLENSRVITPLGDYLKNEIISISGKTGLFKVVQSSKDFSSIGDRTFVYRTDADFDGVLLMNYYIEKEGLHIFLKLNDSSSRKILSADDFYIEKDLFPDLGMKPSNYDDYKNYGFDEGVLKSQDFKTVLWTSRGQSGIYRDGENLVINIRSESNCYIKLFHVACDGKIQLIFPNKFEKNNFIRAGEAYTFPSPSMNFDFKLGPPYGIETIRLVAQSVQFDDLKIGQDNTGVLFTEEGSIRQPGYKGIYIRGLNVSEKEGRAQKSESSYTYNIVK